MSFSDDVIWDKFPGNSLKYPVTQLPKVTIVIPTYNCVQFIPLTLESVLQQDYPDFEVIIIDANSTDRTLEVVKSYYDPRVRIYSVTNNQRYEMLNKGISLATGTYINFLFPSDFYIHQNTLQAMMSLALDHDKPQLVYCGCLLRDGRSEVKVLFRDLSLDILRKGQQPTSLQSCWFRLDLFRELGKFSIDYELRGGFDLLCRFSLHGNFETASTRRVFTDYDLRGYNRQMVVRHFLDTMRAVNRHFGVFATIRWFGYQKDWARYMKLWMRSLQIAFRGSSN